MIRTPLTILITGARDWTDRDTVRHALESAVTAARWQVPEVEPLVVHGACAFRTHQGRMASADLHAAGVAHELGWPTRPMPAAWDQWGRHAEPIRNRDMVAWVLARPGLHVCLAFPLPTSRGTWDCVRAAEQAGIPVTIHARPIDTTWTPAEGDEP